MHPSATGRSAGDGGRIDRGRHPALFLVNRQRLASTYGTSAADAAIADVEALAASPSVDGAVVSIDASPTVRTAYATWDAAACDAGQANEVVSAVNRLVDDLLEPVDGDDAWKGLESVTIVGGDDIIPMARVEDGTASSNEAGYAAEVQEYAADGSAIGPSPLSGRDGDPSRPHRRCLRVVGSDRVGATRPCTCPTSASAVSSRSRRRSPPRSTPTWRAPTVGSQHRLR